MRRFLISLLLASAVAAPALADPNDSSNQHQNARHEHDGEHDNRGDHGNRGQRTERPAPAQRPQLNTERRFGAPSNAQPQIVRQERFERGGQPSVVPDPRQVEASRGARGHFQGRDQGERDGQPNAAPDQRQVEALRGARGHFQGGERGDRAERRWQYDRDSRVDAYAGGGYRSPMVTRPRQGTQPPMRVDNRRDSHVKWNRDWRNDHRYDWRRWRDNHRSRFHVGIYYDPFGWGYQPFSIGWRLWPNYYSSNYWINDPWNYQLPYAPPGMRWVRYYNDVLLVDMYTGQVVDVIHGFFW